jgi:NOL1/NOP2/fmu family ribosome biogenesis protein
MCKELGAELLPIDLHGNNEITTSDVGYRFYPHKTKGEGFFISVFKKKSGQNLRNKNRNIENKNIKFVSKFEIPTLSLTEPERWSIIKENNLIKAYDKKRINDFLMLNRQLKCIHSGVLLGEFKGSDFIPSECMALSKKLDLKSVEIVDVEYNTAISFLKKETIFLTDSKLGYVLICYKGLGLGWVKNLGNRCNNLYPREWRIRIKID